MDGKRFVSMLLPRKDCQLDFNGLLVYSYLTYLTKHGRHARQKAIARALGLHRVTTVGDTITNLLAFGLVEAEGQAYLARDGQTAWFHQRKEATEHWHWIDRYAYYRLYLPAKGSPLSPRQNALLWLLKSWQKKGKVISRQGHASQLRISRRTVSRSITTLTEMGLWDGRKVTFEGHEHLWQDATTKKATASEQRPLRLGRYILGKFSDTYQMEIFSERATMKTALDRHESRLIAAGYKAKDILEVWDYALEALDSKCLYIECYVFHFRKLLEVVEKET